MTATSSVPSSGSNTLNFALIDSSGNVSKTQNNVSVTFNDSTHFTVGGVKYTYDFTWGKNGSKQIILGNTKGGYLLLTDPSIIISNYTYINDSYGNNNHWQVNGTDGSSTALAFQNRGFDPCFLAGTEISVGGKSRPVESLMIGDQVDVFENGKTEQRTVTWIGKSSCVIRPFLSPDQAGYPVRLLKNSLGDGIPFKDMLVTPEHCLFLNNCFVPVRMLVNGRSIFYDQSFASYDYYHVETETHAVILADGVLTESYLDTGNRRSFRQDGDVLSMVQSRDLSWNDAAAPLNVSRDFVEPLFREFDARAEANNVVLQAPVLAQTNDANLHLITSSGTEIRALRVENDRVLFMIPAGASSVRILSNTSRPCDTVGPFVDDRRALGVLIGKVTLFDSGETRIITTYAQKSDLTGWHGLESDNMRWTAGDAFLPLGNRAPGSVALLALQILAAGPYLVTEPMMNQILLQA